MSRFYGLCSDAAMTIGGFHIIEVSRDWQQLTVILFCDIADAVALAQDLALLRFTESDSAPSHVHNKFAKPRISIKICTH